MFPTPSVVEVEVKRQYGVQVVGRTSEIRARFYAISPGAPAEESGGERHLRGSPGRALRGPLARGVLEDESNQRVEGLVAFDRVAQRQVAVDLVGIAAPLAGAPDVPRSLELGDDPLHGSLRNADPLSDVPHRASRSCTRQSSTWEWFVRKVHAAACGCSLLFDFATGAPPARTIHDRDFLSQTAG